MIDAWNVMFLITLLVGLFDIATTFFAFEVMGDKGYEFTELNFIMRNLMNVRKPYKYLAYISLWHTKLIYAIILLLLINNVSTMFGILLAFFMGSNYMWGINNWIQMSLSYKEARSCIDPDDPWRLAIRRNTGLCQGIAKAMDHDDSFID